MACLDASRDDVHSVGGRGAGEGSCARGSFSSSSEQVSLPRARDNLEDGRNVEGHVDYVRIRCCTEKEISSPCWTAAWGTKKDKAPAKLLGLSAQSRPQRRAE